MGAKFVITGESDVPPANAVWRVDLGDDLELQLLYANAAYDLVAYVIARLGAVYSEFILDRDKDKFDKAVKDLKSD